MVVTERPWLIDKSALVRLGDCQEQELWAERIGRGLIHVTTITLLEAGFSAQICFSRRTPRDHLTCHARRPRGTASLPGRAARRRAPPPRHSGREQEAGLPRPGGPGTALVPRPTHAYAGAIWIMCRSHG